MPRPEYRSGANARNPAAASRSAASLMSSLSPSASPRYKTGVFAKYANSVSSAAFGAVTTPSPGREDADGIYVPDFDKAGARGR